MSAILNIRDLRKSYEGGFEALKGVSLDIEEGEILALLGPNGAGKSTLLNCLVGKLIPDSGSVMFDGQSVLGRKPHEINQMGISRVFQTPEIFGDLTVLENMMIPCFAARDGAFRMHAFEQFSHEKELIEKAMQAETRDQLVVTVRALDRVLRAYNYWVPHWYKASHHLAYWDRFSRPDIKPKYARGVLDTWWHDDQKAAALNAR